MMLQVDGSRCPVSLDRRKKVFDLDSEVEVIGNNVEDEYDGKNMAISVSLFVVETTSISSIESHFPRLWRSNTLSMK